MKTKLASTLACASLAVIAALTVVPSRAAEPPAPGKSEAEIRGEAAKAGLKLLDAEIDRVDQMIDNAPSQAERAAAKARLSVLKDRRNELRKTYILARYEELRADLRAETERVGAWAKRTFTSDPAVKANQEMQLKVHDAKTAAQAAEHRAYAEASSAKVATDIAVYKLRPTDTNKEEAKAGLKALDQNIDELAQRIADMPGTGERAAAEEHLRVLKNRRDELQGDFNKARFDALIDDLKRAWDELIH